MDMRVPIIFQCPKTGFSVQALLSQNEGNDESTRYYESVVCSACDRMHFLNLKTGKLLGYEKP